MKRTREFLVELFEEEWTCSITHQPMKDPVTTSDGHSYEKSEITKWLKKQKTSPKTGLKLQTMKIIPNITLKSIIQKFQKEIKFEVEKLLDENQEHQQKITQLEAKIKQLQEEKTHLKTIEQLKKQNEQLKVELSSKDEQMSKLRKIIKGQQADRLIVLEQAKEKNQDKEELKKQPSKKEPQYLPLKNYLMNLPVIYDEDQKCLDHSDIPIDIHEFLKHDWSQLEKLNLDNTDMKIRQFAILTQNIAQFQHLKTLSLQENSIHDITLTMMERLNGLQQIIFKKVQPIRYARKAAPIVVQPNYQVFCEFINNNPEIDLQY